METEGIRPYWIRWVLPSLSDILFLIVFLFLILRGSSLLADGDTGWHIGVGRYILETGQIPKTGIYSYTAENMPWMSHEWLTELIFAGIDKISGLNGIVLISALAIALTHSVFFSFLLYRGVNTVLALLLTVLVMTVTSTHWLARPHILSMPIILIWYMALEAYRTEGKQYIYLLPLLTVLWVNLHGGFMAGLLLIGVYFLGSLLESVFAKDGRIREEERKNALAYGKAGLLATTSSLLNPHGYNALLFPFQIMGQELSVGRVSEWLSPNFHEFLPYEYMLLALIVVLGFSLWRPNFIDAGLVILWVHLSLHSVRYTPIFAIIVAPIMAIRLEGLMKEGMERGSRVFYGVYAFSHRIQETSKSLNTHTIPLVAVAIAVAVIINGGKAFGVPLLEYGFDKGRFPVEAVAFAEKNGVRGKVFNTYHFGGYLIYKGFPKDGVFVDGRGDMYNEFLKNYFDVVDIKQGWRKVLSRFNVEWMLASANSPLSVLLLEAGDWHLIYADKVANIFVRDTSENRHLIDKYTDVKLVADEDNDNNGSK